ncbi:MAG: phosphomannomutase [Rheinheimera aquimaris]|jgi:phosphomannomutase|tara:strand:+ start:3022 stop:5949 length:2928 start_codon:yes stop_codon:yes gene_type:complete
MTVTLKEFISEIRGDRFVRGSFATGLILLVVSSVAVWQQTIVDARVQAVSLQLGQNMNLAASQIQSYLDKNQQSLNDIADQTSTFTLFNSGDFSALDREEVNSAALIPEAESIRYIDSGLERHQDSLNMATTQIIRRSLAGDRGNSIAIKVAGHWKVLLIKPVLSPQIPASAKVANVGGIVLQLPIEGLTQALSAVDVSNGTMQLQQTEPDRNDIIVLSLSGQASPVTLMPIQADHIRMIDTVNPRWKVSFIPSAKLMTAIEDQLPPFWLFFGIAWGSLLPALYLITRYRVSRRSWITDIFIEEHNAQDALFASPNEDEVELVMQAQTLQSDFAAAEPLFDETSSEKPAFDKMPDVDESLETEDFLQSEKTLLDASATEEIQHPDETVSEVKESSEIQETPNTEELPETEDFLRSEKTLLDASATEEIQHPDETVSEVKESLQSQETPNTEETPEIEDSLRSEKTLLDASETEETPCLQEAVATVATSEAEAAELEKDIIPNEYIEAPISGPFLVPDVVFRDYDIRGIAGSEITKAFAERLGKTIGSIILQNGHTSIYIGRDGRISSPELAASLRSGLLSTGCNVIDLGEITTPALNFAVHHCGQSSCGIMVTASHNPSIYNGFKIIIQRQVISGKALQLLKPMLNAKTFTQSDSAQLFSRDIVSQYVRHIVEDSVIDRSFRLAIDAGNSVAGPVAIKLFKSLGCTVFPINCEIDGTFPNHEPNPSEEKNLKQLISKVKEVKADMGLAFDGDGDRIVVISGKGEIIWPDRLMMIFAKDILSRTPGAEIVFDVKSSKRLAQMIGKNSGRPVMCKTGHSHVRKAVQHNNAPLGGEFSGHIFFNDRWKGFDDGLYAASRLLEVLCLQRDSADKTLDQIISKFDTSSYSPEILIPIAEHEKFELMQTLLSGCQFSGAQIISVDGLRAEYPKGWGLIRASNTSANLTLRFEGDDDASLEQVKKTFRRELSPFINQIEDYI